MKTKNFVWYWNIVHYSVYRFLKKQSFRNPTIHAGGFMILLFAALGWGIFNLSQIFFQTSLSDWVFNNETHHILFLGSIAISSLLFNYFILFKNGKCEEYFTGFDGMEANEKTKYLWLSLVPIVFILTLFIVSFKYVK